MVETIIIGAGVIGSSVAMSLAKLGCTSVQVFDRDLEGKQSSSELNAGAVRATWNQPINIRASQLSLDYFETIQHEVGYKACGYLWMMTPESVAHWKKSQERLQSLGSELKMWDVSELKKYAPFIDKTDDLAGAVFAPRDGLINPNLLKLHYRRQAIQSGVQFHDHSELMRAEWNSSGYWDLYFKGQDRGNDPQLLHLKAKNLVNCTGAWAGDVAQSMGYVTDSKPLRRQICLFDSRAVDLSPYGMMIDPSGVYFHPEAQYGIAGVSNRDEPYGYNFNYDGDAFFEERIWSILHERSTAFEQLKHISGWAGLYEVSPDESAIMGKVREGLYEAHSFSGHGVMHSYAAGVGLAELMIKGRYEIMDFNPLHGSRFEKNQLILETAVI